MVVLTGREFVMKWIVLVFMGLQLGCLKIVPKDEKVEIDQSVPVEVGFDPGSKVGAYNVVFSVKRPILKISKVVDGVARELPLVAVSEDGVVVDPDVGHSSLVTYFVQDDVNQSFVVPVQLPFDLVLRGAVDLRALAAEVFVKTYDRIFFEGAQVTLGAGSFELRAKEISFVESRLLSFHGGRADWGVAGLSGGSLLIRGETVSGDLSLGLNGQVFCVPKEIPPPPCRGWRNCLSHPIRLNVRTFEVRGNFRCEYNQTAGSGALKVEALNRSTFNVRSEEGNTGSYCQIDGASEACVIP